jgi:hypothetical protein
MTTAQLEALWLMISRGPYRDRRGYRLSRVVRSLIALGYAVATSDSTAEATEAGRAAYAEAK